MRRFCPIRLSLLILAALFVLPTTDANAQAWTAKLDKSVRFYQTTDLGVLLVGTEKSLYAIDGSTGETLWRRKDVSLDETDVAPVHQLSHSGTTKLLIKASQGAQKLLCLRSTCSTELETCITQS